MMTCSVCPHEKRREIDSALLVGESLRDIAGRYGLSRMALHRHRQSGHIAKRIQRGFDLQEIAEAQDLVEQIKSLLHESAFILEDARTSFVVVQCPACEHRFPTEVANIRDRVAAAAQVGKTLELAGRVSGKISSPSVLAFIVGLGANNESDLRAAWDLHRSMGSASLADVEQEVLASMRFLLAERSAFRSEALALLDGRSGAEVLPDDSDIAGGGESPRTGNGGPSGANGHGHP